MYFYKHNIIDRTYDIIGSDWEDIAPYIILMTWVKRLQSVKLTFFDISLEFATIMLVFLAFELCPIQSSLIQEGSTSRYETSQILKKIGYRCQPALK